MSMPTVQQVRAWCGTSYVPVHVSITCTGQHTTAHDQQATMTNWSHLHRSESDYLQGTLDLRSSYL